jgi:hypothetical protein
MGHDPEIALTKRLPILLAAAAVAAVVLTGCADHHSTSTPGTKSTQKAKSTGETRAGGPGCRRPGRCWPAPLLGVYVFSGTDYPVAQTRAYGEIVLGYLRRELHAQVAGLMWDLCSPGFGSEIVRACANDPTTQTGTMSAPDIAALAGIAKANGLLIQMRPIIRVGPPSGWNDAQKSWEGHISPPDQQKWFQSLLVAELPYLRIAKEDHVEQFVLTTELAGLQFSRSWPWFLRTAQSDCGCQVSYAVQMTQYLQAPGNLPAVSELGTDLYPALDLPASASQAEVTAAWEAYLASVPESRLKRTSLDEISIRATAGAYQHPADWNAGGASDPEIQAKYFTAACHTAAKYHMHALFFYFVPLSDNPAHAYTFPAYFVNNAGSRAIRDCRGILAG